MTDVNPHAEHLRHPITRYPYAYGALDSCVKSFLDGNASVEYLRELHQQLRDGLAQGKAEQAQDPAVES
jgi:hypothetical protein